MANEILAIIAAVIGALIGSAITWLGIAYQNKRWIFTSVIDTRTDAILAAYNEFLDAFFKITKAATVGEMATTLDENVLQPLDEYLIAINKIDVWVSKESSEELRELLDMFRAISHEIMVARGRPPKMSAENWKVFVDSLDRMKALVSSELRSQDLRKFIFSVKI